MKFLFTCLLLTTAVVKGFNQSETSLQLARKHYQEEDYAAALKALEKAAQEEPENAQVPYLTARAYLDLSNYRKAASFMEKAIAMDSSRVNWIYECGLIYYAIPDDKKSLQYLLLAGEKGQKRTNDYLENLGNVYLNLKNYDKGIEMLSEVLKKKPSDPELLFQIAQAYYKKGSYQEAIDHWDRILEDDKEHAEALYMIGLAYQKKGEKQKGQQLCDRAIEMDPSLRSKRQRMGGDF